MARPREFDEMTAVRLMTHAFWSRGYQATSTRDLEDVTGLTTGSIYKAFGSKENILKRCVEYYMGAQSYVAILRRADSPSVVDAFRTVLDAVIDSIEPAEGRAPGCLVTNLAFELGQAEPELGRDAAARLAEMQREILGRLRSAQVAQELDQGRDIDSLSAHLMALLQGMLVMATTTKDRASMQRTRDSALAMLH